MRTKFGVLTISVQAKIKCALGTIVKIILHGVSWRYIDLFKTLFGLNIKTFKYILSGLEHLKPIIISRKVGLLCQVCSFLNIHHSRIANIGAIAINQLFIQAQLFLSVGYVGGAKFYVLKLLIFKGMIVGPMGNDRV